MLRTMVARYRGSCRGCTAPILPGDLINFVRKGQTYHQDCEGKTKVTTVYFPSTNTTIYRNVKGTCEDAPACGCCTL